MTCGVPGRDGRAARFQGLFASNHSNIAEEFLDIRMYGNWPEALAEDFKAAFDAVIKECHIEVEAMAADIQEKHDFFEMFPKLVIKKQKFIFSLRNHTYICWSN